MSLLENNFLTLNQIPNFDEFEIYELFKYYENVLCSNIYEYLCFDSSEKEINIKLSFLPENFVHLVSLDSIVPNRFGNGIVINNIRNKHWTKRELRNFNRIKFKQVKKRMRYLSIVHTLLKTAEFIQFNPKNVVPDTDIKSAFLLTEIFSNIYIHLGIDGPNSTNGNYFPRTLLGENTDKFIKKQEFLKVINKNITKK